MAKPAGSRRTSEDVENEIDDAKDNKTAGRAARIIHANLTPRQHARLAQQGADRPEVVAGLMRAGNFGPMGGIKASDAKFRRGSGGSALPAATRTRAAKKAAAPAGGAARTVANRPAPRRR
jgi:hypothetical protein